MAKLVFDGKLSLEKFKASYGSWKNHISHGNCYKLGKEMDKKIEKVIGSVKDGQKEKSLCASETV